MIREFVQIFSFFFWCLVFGAFGWGLFFYLDGSKVDGSAQFKLLAFMAR